METLEEFKKAWNEVHRALKRIVLNNETYFFTDAYTIDFSQWQNGEENCLIRMRTDSSITFPFVHSFGEFKLGDILRIE